MLCWLTVVPRPSSLLYTDSRGPLAPAFPCQCRHCQPLELACKTACRGRFAGTGHTGIRTCSSSVLPMPRTLHRKEAFASSGTK